MNKQKGFAALILVIVAVFVVGGAIAAVVFINNNQSSIQQEVNESESQQAAQNDGSYPSLWDQASLPHYAGAEVTDKLQGRNLVDGVQVTLKTTDNLATVSTFYESALPALGLIKQGNPPSNDTTYFAVFKNGNKQFSLTLTTNDDGTIKIHGNYHE